MTLRCRLSVCAAALVVLVAGVALGAESPADLAQIAERRATAEADWQRQEQACHSRFIVQSCLDDVAAQRRKLEQTLQVQESAVHALERQQRAQEQTERSAEKQRAHEERVATPAEASDSSRLQAQQDKVQAHQRVAASPVVASAKPQASRPIAAAQSAQREAYAAKQRAAQERRLARDKRLRDATANPQPLPQAR